MPFHPVHFLLNCLLYFYRLNLQAGSNENIGTKANKRKRQTRQNNGKLFSSDKVNKLIVQCIFNCHLLIHNLSTKLKRQVTVNLKQE